MTARRTITPAQESAAIARAHGPVGVSASIRAHLANHPGATSRAVAAGIGLPQPLVYNHLAQMVYTGLVLGKGHGPLRKFRLGRTPQFEPGVRRVRARTRVREAQRAAMATAVAAGVTPKGETIERTRSAEVSRQLAGSGACSVRRAEGEPESVAEFTSRGGRVQVLASVPYVPAIARPVGWKT